jgi:hypothetical protein
MDNFKYTVYFKTMKEGQVLICKYGYLDCFIKDEEYTIFKIINCLDDLMAEVKDKNGKTITWPMKQFEIDIQFTIK